MNELVSLTTQPNILATTSRLTRRDRWDHFLVRVGHRRGEHRVAPGLYGLGRPSPDSAVFVTGNYTLSFDALRSALAGTDAYILVLDTKGVNVWCAAGKGTFGTDELVGRIRLAGLSAVVKHRTLILPQLGAPGVAAHEVKKRTGFRVVYGPVRASDLPDYLRARDATPEMRRVRFTLGDRLVLLPVEVRNRLLPMLIAALVLYFLGGLTAALAGAACILAGALAFPILLPWLPTPNFSTKGFFLGGVVALPFALWAAAGHPDWSWWVRAGHAVEFLLAMPAVTAFVALNFTGATTFTSRTGVKREMSAYIRPMAVTFVTGAALAIVFAFIR
ncbi:MAG: carbon monoxide dehydrogenase [Acidobacteria bacterium]|nr:MAG: carbon monoxide dehydrogenase [Acidobacteriota bacterium]